MEEEHRPPVTSRQLQEEWQQIPDFRYGEKLTLPLGERESVLFLQEIESSEEQVAAVEIGSGNALYLLLNGRYVTAHFSPDRVNYATEIVLLPLRKGVNQLIVKYHNGFEPALSYSITPLQQWSRYVQQLPQFTLSGKGTHSLTVKEAHPQSKLSPLRMSNIVIKIESPGASKSSGNR